MKIDYQYICQTIANLSCLPIRLYKNRKKQFFISSGNFSHDPVDPIEEKIFEKQKNVDYYICDNLAYYGIVNSKDVTIVLGPSRSSPFSEKEIKDIFLQMQLSQSEFEGFVKFMKGIMPMPLESTLQTLCTFNYILNEEKLTLDDFFPKAEQVPATISVSQDAYNDHFNNTYLIEQEVLDIVRHGNVEKLTAWVKNAPAANGGVLSQNALRNTKNTFIVTATVVSRAAIEGGMEVEDALSLSDYYIQKEELMNSSEDIYVLQYQMVRDYTEKVSSLAQRDHSQSRLIRNIKNYVHENITEPIKTEDIAKKMNMERTLMSRRFKAETGENLSDYIVRKKIEKSKLLIKEDYSLISISTYLGFSSQSHFSKLFEAYVGMTPSKYKKTLRK